MQIHYRCKCGNKLEVDNVKTVSYGYEVEVIIEPCDVCAAQQPLAPDSPYVCLHCGAHISSEHLPWCKSLPQNGGR